MEREPSLQTLLTCESQENVNTGNFVCAAAEMSGPSHTEVNPCFYYTAFLPFFGLSSVVGGGERQIC